MSKRAILRALEERGMQVAKTPQMLVDSGAFLAGGPSTNTGYSPVSTYDGAMSGRPYTTALPRNPDDFMAGAFGPLAPLVPVGIDAPDDESGRPMPRRTQYPVGWNMPIGQPGTEGLKLTSFANLRAYADTYSVVRAAIQVRKEEVLGLEWDITPTDSAEKQMRGDTGMHGDFQDRRTEALKFFKKPDANYHDFQTWLGALLEDLFVVDAMSIYIHPSRRSGSGLFGSDLAALEVIDGTTIRPLLDVRGGAPRPPSPSYQQYLWGVPRVDMMDIILESDLDYLDTPVNEYRSDQLMYLPYTRRSWTPYGFPGIERCILPVATGLKKQQWALEFFTEGTIPGLFVIPGPDVNTPTQWRQLQDTLNALAGDTAYKHRIIVLPPQSDTRPQKPTELADQFDENIMVQVLMAYDVMPMELGISPKVSSTQSPGAANQMAKASQDINQRKALRPLLQWMKRSVFDFVLQDLCGQDDMQWHWKGLDEDEEVEIQSDALKTQIGLGIRSVDEARVEMGLNPWGLPLTSDPIYISPTAGPIPFGSISPGTDPTVTGQGIATAADRALAPQVALPGAAAPGSAGATPGQGAGSPGSPLAAGSAGAPAPAAPRGATDQTSTASTMYRSMQQELKQLRRFLRKDRNIATFRPNAIPDGIWTNILTKTIGLNNEQALVKAKEVVRGDKRVAQREKHVAVAGAALAAGLKVNADKLRNGKLNKPGFIKDSGQLLSAQLGDSYDQAIEDAAADYGIDPEDLEDLDSGSAADLQGSDLEDYLAGLADDVSDMDDSDSLDSMDGRFASWGAQTRSAYEQGFGAAVAAGVASGSLGGDDTTPGGGTDSLTLVWHVQGDDADCEQCDGRDGEEYTMDSLPGWPGDGGFGDICDGGPHCRCWIDYMVNGNVVDSTQDKAAVMKNFTVGGGGTPGSPLASGFVPFDLQGARKRPEHEDDDEEPLVVYHGFSPEYRKVLAPGQLYLEREEIAACKMIEPLADEECIAEIVVKCPLAGDVNNYVLLPAMTTFRVLEVGEKVVRVEAQ